MPRSWSNVQVLAMPRNSDGETFVSGLELQVARQRLEAALFAANGPVGLRYLVRRTGQSTAVTRKLLKTLQAEYAGRGIHLVQGGQKYFFTVPDRLMPEPVQPRPKVGLSHQAMEVLALVITKGPLTRRQILELRGVSSDKAVVSLVQRRLLVGHRDYLKKGLVYDLSDELLERWGFASRQELLEDIESRRRGL